MSENKRDKIMSENKECLFYIDYDLSRYLCKKIETSNGRVDE